MCCTFWSSDGKQLCHIEQNVVYTKEELMDFLKEKILTLLF